MLKITNLKKYFGGVKAVEGCNFEVKENTITALIGPNGAGKSTVFNLISGIIKVDTGKIFFSAKGGSSVKGERSVSIRKNNYLEIQNLSPEKISNLGIARLFQQEKLFHNLTVKDNLLVAFDDQDTKFWKNFFSLNKISADKEKNIKEILDLVDMSRFANKLTRDLSFGQKRLVELGRTILNPHRFLMLDEPVAGVNPKLREKLREILLKLKKDQETILLIEHDMNFTFKVADWIIVMDEGKVIAEGKPEEIRNNKKVLEAYLGD